MEDLTLRTSGSLTSAGSGLGLGGVRRSSWMSPGGGTLNSIETLGGVLDDAVGASTDVTQASLLSTVTESTKASASELDGATQPTTEGDERDKDNEWDDSEEERSGSETSGSTVADDTVGPG